MANDAHPTATSNRSQEDEPRLPQGDDFYILSIDGGGFRGRFAAHLLQRMEEVWELDWHRSFDLFAGTSTGSILASGIACGFSATKLADFYDSHGQAIFTPRLRSRCDPFKLLTSRYSSTKLQAFLEREFGDTTLGDVPVPLILPAVDIGNGRVHVVKSKYSDDFVRDPHVRVSDAVLASCSAPTYFDPHVVDDKYELADGGLWANNPSLVAAIDAHYRLGIPLRRLRVLSIGTGTSRAFYPRATSKWKDRLLRGWQGWGIATRWQRTKLLDLILNLQSESAHNMLCLLLGESPLESTRVIRLTFDSDRPLPMDYTPKRDDWLARADRTFTHHKTRIARFMAIPGDGR